GTDANGITKYTPYFTFEPGTKFNPTSFWAAHAHVVVDASIFNIQYALNDPNSGLSANAELSVDLLHQEGYAGIALAYVGIDGHWHVVIDHSMSGFIQARDIMPGTSNVSLYFVNQAEQQIGDPINGPFLTMFPVTAILPAGGNPPPSITGWSLN